MKEEIARETSKKATNTWTGKYQNRDKKDNGFTK